MHLKILFTFFFLISFFCCSQTITIHTKDKAEKFIQEICTNIFVSVWVCEVTYSDGTTGTMTTASTFTEEYEYGRSQTNFYVY